MSALLIGTVAGISRIHPTCLYLKLYGEPLVAILKTINALFHMASDFYFNDGIFFMMEEVSHYIGAP